MGREYRGVRSCQCFGIMLRSRCCAFLVQSDVRLHVCQVKQVVLTDDNLIRIRFVWLLLRFSVVECLSLSQSQLFFPKTSTNESNIKQHTLNNTSQTCRQSIRSICVCVFSCVRELCMCEITVVHTSVQHKNISFPQPRHD